MTHIDAKTEARTRNLRKVLSHVYALLDAILAFFAVWTFAHMMRIVIGLSTDVYWLAKAWIQQVSFIGVSILMFVAIIGGQSLFEREMLKKQVWVPRSFVVISILITLVYAVCKIVIATY